MKIWSQYYLLWSVISFLWPQLTNAAEKITLSVDQITFNDWQIEQASVALSGFNNNTQQFSLSSKKLTLPEPLSALKLVDISCQSFQWGQDKIICQQGRARLNAPFVKPLPFEFSFSVSENKSQLTIKDILWGGGKVSLIAKEHKGLWNVSIDAQKLFIKPLEKEIKKHWASLDSIGQGILSLDAKMTGSKQGVQTLVLNTVFKKLSLQAEQGNMATEALDATIALQATKKKKGWQWSHQHTIKQGELYKAPVYLNVKKEEGFKGKSKGVWLEHGGGIIDNASLSMPKIAAISLKGKVKSSPQLALDKLTVKADIQDFEYLSTHYLLPSTEGTALEGIAFKGKFSAEVNLVGTTINNVSSQFKHLSIDDNKKKRGRIEGAEGSLNWSAEPNYTEPSDIAWDHLMIRKLPFEKAALDLLLSNQKILLLKGSSIPLLEGFFNIKEFTWQGHEGTEPTIYFEGGIDHVSLERLSAALDLPVLSGQLSGNIPRVEYKDKVLKVKSELQVNVFDGVVSINNLASSGLFSDTPKFYMDMKMEQLDLYAITQKVQMGAIEGRVSGFINNLYLENWQPVTFYAWIGTPEDDDSRHRISQKAVENIASIGGGGAADVISKGFLRFFDTFRYDRLGFGCYLYEGVCQSMGVGAAEQGYYIVKGGGLPRIDIVAYNPRVDWKVLIQRLARLSNTDNVVVE